VSGDHELLPLLLTLFHIGEFPHVVYFKVSVCLPTIFASSGIHPFQDFCPSLIDASVGEQVDLLPRFRGGGQVFEGIDLDFLPFAVDCVSID